MILGPAAQARLDDKISALILVLCDLRTQRNTFSPISRLPPEILACIFIHYARSYEQFRYLLSYGLPDWVNVSYVCRHWRAVALNCPTLWTFLFVSSHHWTNRLLARSKAAPLKVFMQVFNDVEGAKQSKELDFLEMVAPQAYRIQDLCLRLTHWEAKLALPWFCSRAPLLQTLRISVDRHNYVEEPLLVSETLFDGDTPALRELELIKYAFRLTSPTLYGVTSLRLRDLGPSFQPTLGELKVALSHMRDLVHLNLENALPSALANSADQSFDGSEKLGFPHLSRLSIIAPSSTVTLLLSCFDLPLKTEVRLRCCVEASDDHTRIYPHLVKRFTACEDQALDVVPIIRTCLIKAALATVGFIFSTTESDFGRCAFSGDTASYYNVGQLHEDWNCNIPLKVDVVRASLSSFDEDLIGGVCRSMPLTNLQSAQISCYDGINLSSAFWTNTFGHLEELRNLRLSQANLQGLVQVLSLSPHSQKNDGNLGPHSDQIFAPTLEELELYNVDFFQACNGGWQDNPVICYRCAHCLYDALSSRQAKGYGLKRLILEECMYISDHDVKDIRELGTDVDWDGVTRTSSDLESEDDSEEDEYLEYGDFGYDAYL